MANGKKLDILTTGRFARVRDSEMAQYGVKKGDIVYLAGEYIIPFKESNPYLLQKIFVAASVDAEGHIVGEVGKGITINPKRLEVLSKAKEESLQAIRDEDFSKQGEVVDESAV